MSSSTRRSIGEAIVFAAMALASCTAPTFGNCFAENGELSELQVAKRGKAATALLEAGNTTAAAFCISRSGFFVTSWRAIPGRGCEELPLILDSGLKTQRILSAKVVHHDATLDLALLQVTKQEDMPVLDLGTEEDLTELAKVVAFGFPVSTGKCPSIVVKTGQVTSLQREAGEVWQIELDAAPGNVGGPVLDLRGNVVGLLAKNLPYGRGSHAVPASHIRRLVSRPIIQLTPPLIKHGDMDKPVTFRASIVRVFSSDEPIDLVLTLSSMGEEREYKMTHSDGVYQVKAVPLPPEKELRIAASYAHGEVQGFTEDRPIQIGNHEVRLRSLRRLRFGPAPTGTLHTGETITGVLSGMDGFAIHTGGRTWALELGKVAQITLDPVNLVQITCRVVGKQNGREVCSVRKAFSFLTATTPDEEAMRLISGIDRLSESKWNQLGGYTVTVDAHPKKNSPTGIVIQEGEKYLVVPCPTDTWNSSPIFRRFVNYKGHRNVGYRTSSELPYVQLCYCNEKGKLISVLNNYIADQPGTLFLQPSDADGSGVADNNVGHVRVKILRIVP
ncbi:MAG: trypsin-like peptidase domain-containing protein [Planctomycetes bacterium]|nr:trypsin-like peptidase domain-containing protein [Planctomycetota bacterium]